MSRWLEKQRLREEMERQQTESPIALLTAETESIPEHDSEPSPPEKLYTWMIGDNIWQVARRLDHDPYELLEHNGIEDYNGIEPGTQLHLMKAQPLHLRKPTTYELFPMPRVMHVNNEGGTHKVFFGNVSEWKDIKPSGALYPQNRNVTVEGLARVPIGDDVAVFYMDRLAFGEYLTTGRVRYAIGFVHAHLSEGSVPQVVEKQKPALSRALRKTVSKLESQIAADALKEGVGQNKLNQEAPLAEQVTPNIYKTTFKPFNEERIPVVFEAIEDIVVADLDTVRPDKAFAKGTTFSILGTFEKDGKVYGRPSNTQYWFGVLMDKVMPVDDEDDSDDEVYNYQVDLPDRVAMGKHSRLTPYEKWVIVPSFKVASSYIKVRGWIKNKQKKEQ